LVCKSSIFISQPPGNTQLQLSAKSNLVIVILQGISVSTLKVEQDLGDDCLLSLGYFFQFSFCSLPTPVIKGEKGE
jgi:hypothetical protein